MPSFFNTTKDCFTASLAIFLCSFEPTFLKSDLSLYGLSKSPISNFTFRILATASLILFSLMDPSLTDSINSLMKLVYVWPPYFAAPGTITISIPALILAIILDL